MVHWCLLASFPLRDGNHATSDDWSSERGAEQVYVLRHRQIVMIVGGETRTS